MIITKRKYKELLTKMERLESNAKVNTYSWGKVDLEFLTKVAEKMQKQIKNLSADIKNHERQLNYLILDTDKATLPWWTWIPSCIISLAAIVISLVAILLIKGV